MPGQCFFTSGTHSFSTLDKEYGSTSEKQITTTLVKGYVADLFFCNHPYRHWCQVEK